MERGRKQRADAPGASSELLRPAVQAPSGGRPLSVAPARTAGPPCQRAIHDSRESRRSRPHAPRVIAEAVSPTAPKVARPSTPSHNGTIRPGLLLDQEAPGADVQSTRRRSSEFITFNTVTADARRVRPAVTS